MYRHCIYCSADLGSNEALEAFPIGRTVAFDAAKGRLWAVCARCARWNLAAIEERWEPVEQAEKAFTDTRLRVQTGSIGLARLADDTRLVRVGEALRGEIAAWRYGGELAGRRGRWRRAATVSVGLGAAAAALKFAGPLGSGGTLFAVGWAYQAGRFLWDLRLGSLIVQPAETASDELLLIRRRDLTGARIEQDGSGSPVVVLPAYYQADTGQHVNVEVHPSFTNALLTRALLFANRAGAGHRELDAAAAVLDAAGDPARVLQGIACDGVDLGLSFTHLWRGVWGGPGRKKAKDRVRDAPRLLALEMALHEEQERRALEGELSVLKAAWRDAEEIAGIADRLALPGEG